MPVGSLDIVVAGAGLILLWAWELSGLDLVLTRLYGGAAGFGLRDAWLTRALLHDGGRALAGCVFVLLVALAWRRRATDDPVQRGFWIGVTLACLLLVPALKRLADTSCPWELIEFGGAATYVPHWRLGVRDGGPGHCFPSGHAVAAFAFLSQYFAWRGHDRRRARDWLIGVCTLGALFGWAQLARGAHFASHTLWSAWLCWVMCAAVARWRPQRPVPISA